MKKFVIDTSAVLALIKEEKGCDVVKKYIQNSTISTVNVVEVLTMMNRNSFDMNEAVKLLDSLVSEVIPFCHEQAYIASQLDSFTRQYGLSLGDKSCLALGKYKNLPVLTADKIWADLNVGVEIVLIR